MKLLHSNKPWLALAAGTALVMLGIFVFTRSARRANA